MQRWHFTVGRLLAVLALMAGPIPWVDACGPSWSVPKNHFDGVNEYGYVSYWEKIGSIDLGQDLTIPLIIGFRSNREWSSPYLGQGWILALLDSQFIPIDENDFQMTQPDGWVRSFGRKTATDKVLEGQGGWKAEIKADVITAWATCGWKFAYTKGKISSITTPKNRTLTFVYTGDRISEVQDGGFPFLRVEADPKTGAVTGLALLRSKQRIEIEMGPRLSVQCAKKENVISGSAPSLKQLTLVDQTVRTYAFDINEQKQPMLKIGRKDSLERAKSGDDRVLAWDAATKMILADDDWTYEVKPAESLWTNAAIGRKNGKGQKEFWHYDAMHGRETVERLDGTKTVKTWFTSGLLNGRPRKTEEIDKNGKAEVVYQAIYDDKGQILEEHQEDGTLKKYSYEPNGVKQVAYYTKNEKYDGTRFYNEVGKLVAVRTSNGHSEDYSYDDHGREIRVKLNGSLHSESSYGPEGSWRKKNVFNSEGQLTAAYYTEYDIRGLPTTETYSMFGPGAGRPDKTVRQFIFDQDRNLQKRIETQYTKSTLLITVWGPDGTILEHRSVDRDKVQ